MLFYVRTGRFMEKHRYDGLRAKSTRETAVSEEDAHVRCPTAFPPCLGATSSRGTRYGVSFVCTKTRECNVHREEERRWEREMKRRRNSRNGRREK